MSTSSVVSLTGFDLLRDIPHLHAPDDELQGHIILSRDYYPVLYEVVRLIKPKTVLEIGTHRGYSACVILEAHPSIGRFVTLDAEIFEHGTPFLHLARENIASVAMRHGIPNAESRKWDTADGLPDDVSVSKWELVYVDGDHTVEGALRDLNLAFAVVADGGYILIDDIHWHHETKEPLLAALRRRASIVLELSTRTLREPRGHLLARMPEECL